MSDASTTPEDTLAPFRNAAGPSGWVRKLGAQHVAVFRPKGTTLLVEFDSQSSVLRRADGLPWSNGLARKRSWTTLSILSQGRTWFRDQAVIDFFDEMTDEGLFDDFDNVVFVGGGVNAYAAAAFSLSAPGSTVFLVAPFATLDREITPWETRFRGDWAKAFGPRYGFAPDMLEAAERVYVVSDPAEALDAMHASLFRGEHITHLPARYGGPRLRRRLEEMGILDRLVAGAEAGSLTRLRWSQLWRARRKDDGWLMNLLRRLDGADRPWLQAICAGQVLDRTGRAAARRRLNAALSQLAEDGREPPAGRAPEAPTDRDNLRLAGE